MKKVKLVIFDFDGVFTDKIYVNDNGTISKSYNPKDSYSLTFLINNNIKIGIVSGCDSNVLYKIDKIYKRADFVITGKYNKCDLIINKCKELNINLEEVAFIGDDIFDSEVMNIIGLSATPSDGCKECLLLAKYVCKNKGGDGAVREFIEYILEYNNDCNYLDSEILKNIKKNGKITAVIPVRSGSTRCKNKNIRPFGDTNLLKRKIEILKQVPEIDTILVSSNCDQMLKIATECGANIHKRDQKYCETETKGSDVFYNLAKNISNELMLYTHCVCPFIKSDFYSKIINIFRNNDNNDCIVSSNNLKHFMFKDNKPFNYDPKNAPPSQFLPDIYYQTFGFNLIFTDFVLKNKSIVGKNPFFYEINQLQAIDIDTPFDFVISELLYNNNFYNIDDITKYLERVDNIVPELLDCTIRDGGYINNWNFTDDEVISCYKAVSDAGFDYFEIGFISDYENSNFGKWYNTKYTDILNVKNSIENGCKIAAMLLVENNPNFIPINKSESGIDLLRLHNRFENNNTKHNDNIISLTIDLIKKLKILNYEVCINLASVDTYNDNLIDYILDKYNNCNIKCIYIADTYGNLNEELTHKLLSKFCRKTSIPLAFHSHNNMGNALAKSKIAYKFPVLMLDSTIGGLGRGAGNLNSELIVLEINRLLNYEKYNVYPLLKYLDNYIIKHNYIDNNSKYIYNNTVLYALTGYLNIHPDYVKDIINMNLEIESAYELLVKIKKYSYDNNMINYNKNIFTYL